MGKHFKKLQQQCALDGDSVGGESVADGFWILQNRNGTLDITHVSDWSAI